MRLLEDMPPLAAVGAGGVLQDEGDAGAGLFKGADMMKNGGLPPGFAAPFFWGFVSAAVSGYLVIWWLLSYLRRRSFALFMWYRLAVAALVFSLVATGLRPSMI